MIATNRMSPVHPGEILREEMDECDLSANALAQALDIPTNRNHRHSSQAAECHRGHRDPPVPVLRNNT